MQNENYCRDVLHTSFLWDHVLLGDNEIGVVLTERTCAARPYGCIDVAGLK